MMQLATIFGRLGLTKRKAFQALQAMLARRALISHFDQAGEYFSIADEWYKFRDDAEYRRSMIRVGKMIEQSIGVLFERQKLVAILEEASPTLSAMLENEENNEALFNEEVLNILAHEIHQLLIGDERVTDGDTLLGPVKSDFLVPVTRRIRESSNALVRHLGVSKLYPDIHHALTVRGERVDELLLAAEIENK